MVSRFTQDESTSPPKALGRIDCEPSQASNEDSVNALRLALAQGSVA